MRRIQFCVLWRINEGYMICEVYLFDLFNRPVSHFNMPKVQTVIAPAMSVDGWRNVNQPHSKWMMTEQCLTKSQHNSTTYCCVDVSSVMGDRWRERSLTIVLKALPSKESPRTLMATKATWNHKQMLVRWLMKQNCERKSKLNACDKWVSAGRLIVELFYCSVKEKAGDILYFITINKSH